MARNALVTDIVLLLLVSTQAQADDISGSWNASFSSSSGKANCRFVLRTYSEVLTGTVNCQGQESPIEFGAVDGSRVHFVVYASIDGLYEEILYVGHLVSPGTIQLARKISDGEIDALVATRAPAAEPRVSQNASSTPGR
jgi:hypothetical protein